MVDASGVAKISGEAMAATRAALDDASAVPDQAAELDLGASEDHLGLPDAGEVLAIQAEMGGDINMAVVEWRRRAGKGGRKRGAVNRKSADFARYLLQFGPHPGVAMMRTIARPVELLAAELGCTLLEAKAIQQRAEAELLPYFESKKPVAVDFGGQAHMTLILGQAVPGAGPAAAIGPDQAALPISFADDVETAHFQEVSGQHSEASE